MSEPWHATRPQSSLLIPEAKLIAVADADLQRAESAARELEHFCTSVEDLASFLWVISPSSIQLQDRIFELNPWGCEECRSLRITDILLYRAMQARLFRALYEKSG